MFKLFDLNMKEISIPDGVKPLDIFVGSIAKERQTEAIPGRNGIVDYGANYTERSVDLSLWIISNATVDYRLLRNELYALFDRGNAFYIAESNVPSRVLKVAVDESYIPERITRRHASVEISCRTLDSVFWESTYTTSELHDSGFDAIVEKYGMADSINSDMTKYVFEQDRTLLNISGNAHENGSLYLSNGQNADGNTDLVRTRGYINVVKDEYYELKYTDDNSLVSYVRIFQYDSAGNYLHSDVRTSGALATFTADGSRIRLLYYAADTSIPASEIGASIIPYLDGPAYTTNFSLWNAGNVTVEPEFMELYIQINSVTSNGNLVIKNITTGDEFKFEKNLSKRHIVIDRMNIRNGTSNALRDTNRRFIKITPGKNEFQITGEAWNNIMFIFKFYYK